MIGEKKPFATYSLKKSLLAEGTDNHQKIEINAGEAVTKMQASFLGAAR